MTRRVAYVSGTRADFGLMKRTLRLIAESTSADVAIIATGMHLSPLFGNTVNDIEASGLPLAGSIPVPVEEGTGASMAVAIADMLRGLVPMFEDLQPDAVLALGDRGEMLAAVLAAVHLNVHVFHVHGGERTGTIDESVRHAISKLAHFHLVATEASRRRVIRMGEVPERVYVTGAPGIDELRLAPRRDRAELLRESGFDSERPVALLLYHPVLQSAQEAGEEFDAVLRGLARVGCQVLCLMPNSDAGSGAIREQIGHIADASVQIRTHLQRDEFIAWLQCADVMVGNSSSGIIEAASFGTPVVNIGERQNLRERNRNVVDVAPNGSRIASAVKGALSHGRFACQNIYGDGHASSRIAELVTTIPLDASILHKSNTY